MHKPYYSIFIMIYSNIQEYKVHNNLNLLKLFRRPWLVLFGASVGVWSLHGLDKVVVSGFPGYELKNLQACFWGRVNLWMEFWVSWVYIFQGKAGLSRVITSPIGFPILEIFKSGEFQNLAILGLDESNSRNTADILQTQQYSLILVTCHLIQAYVG